GGGITLRGQRSPTGWQFRGVIVDQTPAMLDEDEIRRESGLLETWEEALTWLDRERWVQMAAMYVHPEFRQRVWSAVQARILDGTPRVRDPGERLERWRIRCTAS